MMLGSDLESLDHMALNGQDLDHQSRCSSTMVESHNSKTSLPDVLSNDLQSLSLHGGGDDCKSFLLLDQREGLTTDCPKQFCTRLGSDPTSMCKVISIVGNTGEGKSHTLNHAFFGGEEVFSTSNQQESCTDGVWASYDPTLQAVVLDTEGMLGVSDNQNIRTRLLLKVLAVSDIVIYRTRAERLHNDMFYFLGDASRAYNRHFQQELARLGVSEEQQSLGPAVLVFHETQHTDVLARGGGPDPDTVVRERFRGLKQDITAFSKIKYVGTKTELGPGARTNFKLLRDAVASELKDNSVRAHRSIALVHQAFDLLNKKFSGVIAAETAHSSFPDEYFTCPSKCQSCDTRCCQQMKHTGEHRAEPERLCSYSSQYENKIYTCQNCKENGRRCVVVPKATSSKESSLVGLAKFAWSGFVLECQKCGVIYRSRQQWYGNCDPEQIGVVHIEVAHVWPGVRSLQGTHNAARRVLDSVTAISGSVADVSSTPAASLARWAADQVAPNYWIPNSDITNCHHCNQSFSPTDKIHHCRACGEGFCPTCSNYQRPVPERGWGFQAVRVCRSCHTVGDTGVVEPPKPCLEPKEVQVRKYGETVYDTVTSLATALEFPISVLKDSARPEYWVPDHEISQCNVCDRVLGPTAPPSQECSRVHHCRQCGQGVCGKCSGTRRPVPSRGWDTPVRVCDDCLMMPDTS